MIKIIVYTTPNGKSPFTKWLMDLDVNMRAVLRARLNRISLGNFGDCKLLKDGGGVRELRIDQGPGYRVYYGLDGETLIILLLGGDKKSQTSDIEKAKRYWTEYKGSKQ